MRNLKKIEIARDGRSVFVNDKYEIDAYSGAVYYDHEYIGNRGKDFPQWIFELVEKLKLVGIIGWKMTYAEKKEQARQEAIEWQQEQAKKSPHLSELVEQAEHFRKIAKKYGLTREFVENGIL